MTEAIACVVLLLTAGLALAAGIRLGRRRGPARHSEPEGMPDAAGILAAAPVSVMVTDLRQDDMPIVYANERLVELTGYPASQILGRNPRFLQGPRREPGSDIRLALSEGRSYQGRIRNYREDGTPFWNALHLAPLRANDGSVSHYVGVQTDITTQVETERRLRDGQRQQYALATIAQLSIETEALDTLLNETLAMLTRVLDLKLAGVIEHLADTDTFRLRAGIGWQEGVVGRATARPGRNSPEVMAFEDRQTILVHDIRSDDRFGTQPVYERHGIRSSVMTVLWAGNQPWGLLGTLSVEPNRFRQEDVEFVQATAVLLGHAIARHQHVSEIAHQRTLLDAIISSSIDAIITIDETGIITSANPGVQTMLGHAPGDLIGHGVSMLMPEAHAIRHHDYLSHFLSGGPPRVIGIGRELQALHRQGHEVPVDLSVAEIMVEGRRLFVGTLRDLTQRQAMQAQLFQAQKMEAIGQLTGGVAHDFNNLLTVIVSNLSSLLEHSDDPEARQWVEETLSAAHRGSTLTQRLLAFSRQQPLAPQRVDVANLIQGLERLLERTFAEHYEVSVTAAENLWTCTVDPGHLEAALLNLAVNARDAMPDGGSIRIETANLEFGSGQRFGSETPDPGDYVAITVIDSGTGMTDEVMINAFEPFFTTKAFGQGSGLGLSMVFGFVKQSGGHVRIESELGVGTRVTLLLPRAEPATTEHAAPGAAPVAVPEPVPNPDEQPEKPLPGTRILMVEDDPLVGSSTRRMLERAGYDVTLAADGQSALDLLEEAGPFDLLFTDVVMPGSMNGRDLAHRARGRWPLLKILFTSGYTDTDLFDGEPSTPVHFLQKPYSREVLARTIREALAHDAGNRPLR
ncbi:MAG: PAS domain S-box protein [Gammaproteobacteria bacterium]|nr:PAS domain S-box protein [Gammaproteobacteria bacterium]